MKFTTNKIEWTEAMKSFAQEQVEKKLTRIAHDLDSVEMKISKISKQELKVSVSYYDYRAQSTNEDFYIAVVDAIKKIKQIIVKDTKKINKHETLSDLIATQILSSTDSVIGKEKLFFLEPETIYSAIDKFEKTDYTFYVFKDIDCNNDISIIYRKFDETYGVIRCR